MSYARDHAEIIARVAEDILLGRRVASERHREFVSYLEHELVAFMRQTVADVFNPQTERQPWRD